MNKQNIHLLMIALDIKSLVFIFEKKKNSITWLILSLVNELEHYDQIQGEIVPTVSMGSTLVRKKN